MSDIEVAVEQFLDESDTAFEEYEQGYTDADATLRILESHIEELRESVE